MNPTIKDFIGSKAIYDRGSQMIFGVQNNGHNQLLVDVRGWGAIQHLFEDSKGKIDMGKAAKFQDDFGQWITDAINEKLAK